MHTVLWNALRKAAQWEKVSRLNSCHWYRHSTTTQVTQCLMQPECCSCWSWKIHIFRINLNWHLTKSLVDKSIAFAIVKTIKFNLQTAHLEVLWQLRSWLTLTLGECGCNATNGSNSLLSTPFCVVDKSLFVYVLVFVCSCLLKKNTTENGTFHCWHRKWRLIKSRAPSTTVCVLGSSIFPYYICPLCQRRKWFDAKRIS